MTHFDVETGRNANELKRNSEARRSSSITGAERPVTEPCYVDLDPDRVESDSWIKMFHWGLAFFESRFPLPGSFCKC